MLTIKGKVVNSVAGKMVANVVGDTSLTAEELDLTLGLESASTGGETTSDDTSIEESTVVRASGESGTGPVQATVSEVLLQEPSQNQVRKTKCRLRTWDRRSRVFEPAGAGMPLF